MHALVNLSHGQLSWLVAYLSVVWIMALSTLMYPAAPGLAALVGLGCFYVGLLVHVVLVPRQPLDW